MQRFVEPLRRLMALGQDVDDLKVLAAQPLVREIRAGGVLPSLREAEFSAFSQFGDDGIIQYLIRQVRPLPDTFIEFGVENYRESNTRFLLLNDNWRGFVMDGRKRAVDYIKRDRISWRHTLTACHAFITRDNINPLLESAGFPREVGILSVDIDGNDYWVWSAIDVVDPVIVIVEYNAVFGPDLAVTIPYDPEFTRHRAHPSGLFWGASLAGLASLAADKGYSLVGSNSAGNNAYFVRNDRVGRLPVFSAREAFVDARFRDSRDERGHLTYLTGPERMRAIAHLSVHDVRQDRLVPLSTLVTA